MAALEQIFRTQMAATVAQLREEGFAPPLYCAFIDRQGSTVCGRYDDRGRRGLVFTLVTAHMATEQFALPIHVMLVDQHGEAAHVALDRKDLAGTTGELN
jgi:hypothetical protein